MTEINVMAITEETMMTLLKSAVAFREVLMDSSCGGADCKACQGNADIIEEISEAIDIMAEGLGVDIECMKVPNKMPDGEVAH
jgi:hypothetical protein